MNRNPNAPSATRRSAAAEAAPTDGPKEGKGQEAAGASSGMPFFAGCQVESSPMEDRWNFRLLA
jgi:hypothetical protein